MKRITIAGLMMFIAAFAFAQKNTDPGLSAKNYKHPDKAAYAKKHNLDGHTQLEVVTVASDGDYKHPKATKSMTKKSALSPRTGMNPAASHKHPLGR